MQDDERGKENEERAQSTRERSGAAGDSRRRATAPSPRRANRAQPSVARRAAASRGKARPSSPGTTAPGRGRTSPPQQGPATARTPHRIRQGASRSRHQPAPAPRRGPHSRIAEPILLRPAHVPRPVHPRKRTLPSPIGCSSKRRPSAGARTRRSIRQTPIPRPSRARCRDQRSSPAATATFALSGSQSREGRALEIAPTPFARPRAVTRSTRKGAR